jgi:predicted RNase H-like nuclease (RuvC/YqgF family)
LVERDMLTYPEWIQALGGFAAGAAAVLAWVAKIRWSAEYRAAKDAHVQVLEEKVSLYKAASSPKLLLRYQEMMKALEDEISQLQKELSDLREVLASREAQLEHARRQVHEMETHVEDVEAHARLTAETRVRAEELSSRLARLERVRDQADEVLHGDWSDPVSIVVGSETRESSR